MLFTLDQFFYDPAIVPIFFAIDALLALVGMIIRTF
ncbi:MAG: hypothetical protein QOC76_842 [Mycobacterium sp.]|jgi:hypothetical protein|nr:hypothetical protein [Mycobacterium sp.]